jgi:hypothetical protein
VFVVSRRAWVAAASSASKRKRDACAQSWTLADIAAHLGVSKSSVSVWVRDVDFIPSPRRAGARRRPHPAHETKLRELAECAWRADERISALSDDGYFAAGLALYAGEGSKTDGAVQFANTDPALMGFFCTWLRRNFDIDESRLRVRVYLHAGLDLDAAEAHWSRVTHVPRIPFRTAYRPEARHGVRYTKHEFGCAYVCYPCSRTHREIMALIRALVSSEPIPG